MLINEALRLIRVYNDITPQDLAKKLNIKVDVIYRIEAKRQSVTQNVLELYSQEFNIPISSLWFFAEEFPNASKGQKVKHYFAQKIIDFLTFIERKTNVEPEQDSDNDEKTNS